MVSERAIDKLKHSADAYKKYNIIRDIIIKRSMLGPDETVSWNYA